MDTIDDISKSIDSFINPIFSDRVGAAVISLVIVLYAGLAAPKLPHSIAKLFSNKIFKLLVLIFVAYTASKNVSIAIITAVALLISMQTLSKFEDSETVIQELEKEVKDDEEIIISDEKEVKLHDDSNVSPEEPLVTGVVSEEKHEITGEQDSTFAAYKPDTEVSESEDTPVEKEIITKVTQEIESELENESEVSEEVLPIESSDVSEIQSSVETESDVPEKPVEEPKKVTKKVQEKVVTKKVEEKEEPYTVTGYEPEVYASY